MEILMLQLIDRYLTRHFYVSLIHETILIRFEEPPIAFFSSHGLTDELQLVFGIPRDYARKYIQAWVFKYYTWFPFDKYWKRPRIIDAEEELTMMLAQQIAIEVDRDILGDILLAAEQNNNEFNMDR